MENWEVILFTPRMYDVFSVTLCDGRLVFITTGSSAGHDTECNIVTLAESAHSITVLAGVALCL